MTIGDFNAFTLRDLKAPAIATEYLSILLRRQELTLLLGAGVSIGAGMPNWDTLVAGCETSVGIVPRPGRSTQELMRAIDAVRRHIQVNSTGTNLDDVVRQNLYPASYLMSSNYPTDVLQNSMLIAIGALVMASARGSVGDVFTLNFDDLLEWYLHLHGFSTQVVPNFPSYLRGDVDVTIFHPHGFLPLMEDRYPRSSWLVLSHTELVARLAASAETGWPTLMGSRFMSKRLLAVGTSMNDLDIDVIVKRAKTSIASTGPMGFVVDANIDNEAQESLIEAGLVPVSVGSVAAIPDFLLGVCRAAAI